MKRPAKIKRVINKDCPLKNKNDLTKDDIEKIHDMTSKGFGDVDIVEKLQVKPFAVQQITTKYWNDKMKQKYE